jgi:flagellar biosynthetic protein FliR
VTESFLWLPAGSFAYDGAVPALGALLLSTGLFLFESALLMAFPLMAVLLLTSLAQGALARVLPELDFFAFGFTVRAAVGLLVVLLSLPFISLLSQNLFLVAFEDARVLVKSLSP